MILLSKALPWKPSRVYYVYGRISEQASLVEIANGGEVTQDRQEDHHADDAKEPI
jgi:hypothetical protein